MSRDFGLGVSYSFIVGSPSQHLSPALHNTFCCLFWIGQFLGGAACCALSDMGVDRMYGFLKLHICKLFTGFLDRTQQCLEVSLHRFLRLKSLVRQCLQHC